VSLTNEQIEEQMLQFAQALEKMSELTAAAIEKRDQKIADLSDRIEAIEQRNKQITELSDRIQALEKPAD
tara:strand:- start:72 stop:281 length:210 start_codon:yes stop_codon:yes gene_type:complete